MQTYSLYLRECLPLALRGSIRGALNWVAILVAALLGGFAQYLEGQLVFAEGWLGIGLGAVISAFLLWLFIVVYSGVSVVVRRTISIVEIEVQARVQNETARVLRRGHRTLAKKIVI